jgi:hypothetical protein
MVSMEQYPYQQGERSMEIMMKIISDKLKDKNHEGYYVEELSAKLMTH